MKTNLFSIANCLALTALLAVGCTKLDQHFYGFEQQTSTQEEPQEVSFFANTSEVVDIPGLFESPLIRAEGTHYGVFAWSPSASVNNRDFVGTASNLQPADGAPLLISAGNGVTTSFAAYAPYSADIADGLLNNVTATDFLVGYTSVNGSLTGKSITFDMKHLLGKLTVEVDGSAAGEAFSNHPTISIDGGGFTSATYSVTSKAFTTSGSTPLALAKSETEGKIYFVSGLVVPQSLAGKKVSITADSNRNYEWTIPEGASVKANTITLFKLSLSTSGFVFGTVDHDWESMDGGQDVLTPTN
jgi:hypothetical protein